MKKLLLNNLKAVATIGLSVFALSAGIAQTNVTVDASDAWVGGMNVYNMDGTWNFYSDWGIADIKTEVNTTSNTLTLYPNYNTYNPADPFWSNGEMGNKITEGFSMVINDELAGEDITFSGTIVSNTLVDAYVVKAFVKALDAGWQPLGEVTQTIDEPGNFTVTFNGSQYATAAHIQYGFIVKGINANPANMNQNGFMVVTEGEAQEPEEPATTIVTIDATSALVGYANWYELDGTTYVAGSEWGVADIKTSLNSDGTLTLQPNFNAYANANGDAYWVNGDTGAKVFEGNTYVQDDNLAGQTFTFKGNVIDYTLDSEYEAIAFIKIFDATYSNLQMMEAPLVEGETFSITATPAAGSHIQYGYAVTGVNANPTQETALGFVNVGPASLATQNFAQVKTTVYPNPASSVLNIVSDNTIEGVAVYNMLGQQVMARKFNATQATLDVSILNNGVYILNATVNGEVKSSRFVKQ